MRKSPAIQAASAWLNRLIKEDPQPGISDAEVIALSGVKRASFYRLKAGTGGADNDTLAKLAAFFEVKAPRIVEVFVVGPETEDPNPISLLITAEQAIVEAREALSRRDVGAARTTSPAPTMAKVIQEAGDVVRDDQARRRSQPSKPAGRGGKKRKRA